MAWSDTNNSWTGTLSVTASGNTLSWSLTLTSVYATATSKTIAYSFSVDGTTVVNSTKTITLGVGESEVIASGTKTVSSGSHTCEATISSSGTWQNTFSVSMDGTVSTGIADPTNVTATGYDSSTVGFGEAISLSWTAVSGATGYEIRHNHATSEGSYVTVGTVSTNSATDTLISNAWTAGKTVAYSVRAKSGSTYSNWVNANSLTITGRMYTKASSAWNSGTTWVKVNGTWTRAKRVYVKVNGTWRVTT